MVAPKYDGTNSGALVFDSTGTAYVGDVKLDSTGNIDVAKSELQPLATRTGLVGGNLVQYDSSAQTLKDSGKKISDLALTSQLPTVNNGTLTIQKNGTNVATFGANQKDGATANITVPTKASDVNALSLDGGTIKKSKTIKMDASANSDGANLKWGTVNSKNPYIGYASDQVDGTFVVGSLLGTNYASGLAIGGGSGNLLWKGTKVATTSDIPTDYVKYTAQTLTAAQKSQARSNIGAGTSNFSGNYNDLSHLPTIPAAANNGTLTIQKNGTKVQTFTANQSSSVTANITVPTKVSELTNDSGFITSDGSVKRVIDYNDTSKNIKIGYSGAGITGGDIKYIAGYTVSDGTTGNVARIKDISKDALKSWLGYATVATSGSYNDLTDKPTTPGALQWVTPTSVSEIGDAIMWKVNGQVFDIYQIWGTGSGTYGTVAVEEQQQGEQGAAYIFISKTMNKISVKGALYTDNTEDKLTWINSTDISVALSDWKILK